LDQSADETLSAYGYTRDTTVAEIVRKSPIVRPAPAPVPGIVTAELAGRARLGVGGTFTMSHAGGEQPIKVVGVTAALPSTAPDRPAVLVDLSTLTERFVSTGRTAPQPGEWWLTAPGAATAPAARALASGPDWNGTLVDRTALRRALRDAPLGAALQGALVIGFLAALALVMIGFMVNATVAVRERTGEFSVLRGLGASRRQIFGLLGLEQAVLVVLGLAGGTLLGVVLAHLVVPRVVLTVRGGTAYPPVETVVSWPPLLVLLGTVLLVLATVLALGMRGLRAGGTAPIGEDP
jgi:hypothetical protein